MFFFLWSFRRLNDNRISHVSLHAFRNLHALHILHLENNRLMQLDGDVFYDLHRLDQL